MAELAWNSKEDFTHMAGTWHDYWVGNSFFIPCGVSLHRTHMPGRLHRVLLTNRMAWIYLHHSSWVPEEQRQKLSFPLKLRPEVAQHQFFLSSVLLVEASHKASPAQKWGCAGNGSRLLMGGLECTYRKQRKFGAAIF